MPHFSLQTTSSNFRYQAKNAPFLLETVLDVLHSSLYSVIVLYQPHRVRNHIRVKSSLASACTTDYNGFNSFRAAKTTCLFLTWAEIKFLQTLFFNKMIMWLCRCSRQQKLKFKYLFRELTNILLYKDSGSCINSFNIITFFKDLMQVIDIKQLPIIRSSVV